MSPDYEGTLDRLRLLQEGSSKDLDDGLMLVADTLPYRERVLWVCRCVRDAAGPIPDPGVMASIEATERCALNPTSKNKAAAKAACDVRGVAGAAVYTAAWAAWEEKVEVGATVARVAVVRARGAVYEGNEMRELRAALETAENELSAAKSAAAEARAARMMAWPVEWRAAAEAEAAKSVDATMGAQSGEMMAWVAALPTALARWEEAKAGKLAVERTAKLLRAARASEGWWYVYDTATQGAAEEATAARARARSMGWQADAEAEAARVAEAEKSVDVAWAAWEAAKEKAVRAGPVVWQAVAEAEAARVEAAARAVEVARAAVRRAEAAVPKRFIGYAIEILEENQREMEFRKRAP